MAYSKLRAGRSERMFPIVELTTSPLAAGLTPAEVAVQQRDKIATAEQKFRVGHCITVGGSRFKCSTAWSPAFPYPQKMAYNSTVVKSCLSINKPDVGVDLAEVRAEPPTPGVRSLLTPQAIRASAADCWRPDVFSRVAVKGMTPERICLPSRLALKAERGKAWCVKPSSQLLAWPGTDHRAKPCPHARGHRMPKSRMVKTGSTRCAPRRNSRRVSTVPTADTSQYAHDRVFCYGSTKA